MRKQKIKKPIIDGIKFDSDLEGRMYEHFKNNTIHKLPGLENLKGYKIINPRTEGYDIFPSFKRGSKSFRCLRYTPDFIIKKGKEEIVLEVKSKWTAMKPDYRLRLKMFLYKYGDKLKFAELIEYNRKKYELIKYY